MLGLLYFGRLEKEKGFNDIIEMILIYEKNEQELPFELFVFGSGTYEAQIQQLAHRHRTIHYFGWQPLETIKRYVSNCEYVLMPSRCLESFGLTALTALKWGIQPIGYVKGGTQAFIDPNLDIENMPGDTAAQKLYHKIEQLNQETPHINRPLLEDYSKENRKANLAYHAEGKRKILIVSDFKSKIGGIETYIHETQKILNDSGYEVQIYGARVPGGIRGKIIKILGIGVAIINISEALALYETIRKNKPEIIRFHSILRYMGRLPLRISKRSSAEKWMMYHDLGYFFPFPRKLEHEEDIQYPFTLKNFIRSTKTKNPIIILASTGKYFLLKLIQNQLKKRVKKHFVPSPFMKPILHKSFNIPENEISIFPHFIQE